MHSLKDSNSKSQHVTLPENSKLNQSMIDEIDLFIDTVSPKLLKENILELYFTYIIRESEMLPWDISAMSANIYFLMGFLDKLEADLSLEDVA